MTALTAAAWFTSGILATLLVEVVTILPEARRRLRAAADQAPLRVRDPNLCQWPADGHYPSGSAGASTDWVECGAPASGWHASTPAAITLSILPVCAEHLETARGVWNIHPPAEADDNPLDVG